jgi:hypothetical protein
VKRTGKWTCRPECVVLVVKGGVGISEGVVVGVVEAAGLDVVCQLLSSLICEQV